MKHLLVLALLGFLLAATGKARGDDVKDVEKHLKTLKTSKNTGERLSAVSDLQLISSLNFAAVFPGIPVLTDVLATDKDQLAKIHAAILGNFGGQDQGIPPEAVHAFEAAMKSLGKPADIKIYPDAGHAFENPNNKTGYRPADAADALARIDRSFADQLGH